MKKRIRYLTIIFVFLNIVFAQYNNLNFSDPLSETALYPVPKEMSFEEYQDMNRRMSQALLWSSIPIPGITHYYAGDKKKAKKIFYVGASGFACIVGGLLYMKDAEWPDNRDNYFIQNQYQDNERWFEKTPVSVDISESGEESVQYSLKEIQKESDGGGGFLIFIGAAIVLGDLVYDRIVGLRLIEQKRDKVRFKYGQKLNFSFDPLLSPSIKEIKLNFKFPFG
ncbi:MAG: hypothetical protein CBE24_05775 [bacterium TMED264]|nr:MAG: hypothetical protein CBE24_05775 [bacterium TMED264]